MIRKFVCPEIVFGGGCLRNTAEFAAKFELQNILLVTDEGLINAGWVSRVEDQLQEIGISYTIFDNITPNPKMAEVMLGTQAYLEAECDGIIAVGGGSVMDCAKGIAIVATNGGHITDYEGVDKVMIPMPPLICVPTTSGSSADVSQFSIITDTDRKLKMAIISKAIVPDVAIIDPETLLTMDSYLSACTGIDALTHSIESYVSNANSCLTDPHALRGIELVVNNLLPSMEEPKNMDYRINMMLGSMEAGLAFSNASLGMVHAMAHSLGGLFDLAHGECNALLLDQVIDFNYESKAERYNTINGLISGISNKPNQVDELINAIQKLKKSVGIQYTLGNRGVKDHHISSLAANASKDACIYTNPRKSEPLDIEGVYRSAM